VAVAILIPSLGRPQYVKRVYANIEANTPEPHEQVWCVSGKDYEKELMECKGGNLAWKRDDDDEDKRYVTRMNKLAAAVLRDGSFDFVFFGSDDVVHHPRWLTHALDVMEEAPGAQVVVVNDLRNPNGTQALMDVSYFDKAVFDDPSVVFHPGYQHNFADTEQFFTAKERDVIYRAMDSHVEHLHPLHRGFAQRPMDETYRYAQAHWNEDSALFERRMVAMKEVLHGEADG